jgi:hypothetical protein
MDMTVLIEPTNGRFRASTSQPVAMEAEGASRDEALQHLRELAAARVAAGELVSVPLPADASDHPWMRFAGIWKDYPHFDRFIQNIADHRQVVKHDS